MKRFLILISTVSLIVFSCKKADSDLIPASLDGRWKMILVKDNSTNTVTTKPASLYGDVIITFVSNNLSTGIFSGDTPTNHVGPNTFSLGSNRSLSIEAMSMTKVAETSWGMFFVANIRDAQLYSLGTGEILNILTANKTLIFKKV